MKITIDNREIKVKEDITILDAAEEHDIYIPHLCSHPELTSYGGCRLCIVEVEGMKGYPTACTAKVEDGMKVRTRTELLTKEVIIEGILSIQSGDNPRVIEQKLKAFIAPSQREEVESGRK